MYIKFKRLVGIWKITKMFRDTIFTKYVGNDHPVGFEQFTEETFENDVEIVLTKDKRTILYQK